MLVCGMYIWVYVTIVCVGMYTIYRCDMYSAFRHKTCVSGSSVSGGRFSAVIVRGLFFHCDRSSVWRRVFGPIPLVSPSRPSKKF